ncbi:MAG: hypothetical protein ABI876_10890 [Bacteroidota bacterium]
MMNRFRILLLIAPLLFTGCDSPSGPADQTMPLGRYARTETGERGGVMTRTNHEIDIHSESLAWVRDTVFLRDGSDWKIDAVSELKLQMSPLGDGYSRTLEIHMKDGAPVDTTLRYWSFLLRNDSLYFYTGSRFLGYNIGIVGHWESDPADTEISGQHSALTFTDDSVHIERNLVPSGVTAGTFHYQTDRQNLSIEGSPIVYGNRYQVFPGWSCYITSSATDGFQPVN